MDAIVGTTAFDSIALAVEEALKGSPHNHLEDIDRDCIYGMPRSVTTGGHYAYLKIAEGCNKRCTYCVIPSVRGNYRSVPMESLVREARTLVAGGVKELILVAQETTLYGVDLYGEKMLPELLRKLSSIEGLVWIRLLSAIRRRSRMNSSRSSGRERRSAIIWTCPFSMLPTGFWPGWAERPAGKSWKP